MRKDEQKVWGFELEVFKEKGVLVQKFLEASKAYECHGDGWLNIRESTQHTNIKLSQKRALKS